VVRQDLPSGLGVLLERALSAATEKRFADASRMYESLLAYLYASGDRFGSGDLSTFVSRFRDRASGRPPELSQVVTEDASEPVEITPVEIPSQPQSSPVGLSEPPNFSAITSRAAGLGERREVTALVLRLGGWAGAIPAERRQRVREIVARYGGYLLEEEAPHAAALFGLGEADGRDTETAVRCALVALRRMGGAAGSKPEPRGTADQSPSAGIHSGRVLLSPQGEPKRDERLSALLAAAQEMARLRERSCGVSVSAARNIRGLFLFEASTDAHKKSGSPTGLLVSELKTPGEGLGRFVGRKHQLKRIGEILSLASRRRVFVITVRGSQGAGKTRLLYETERRLKKGEYKVAFYMGTCPPSGSSIPLSGITSLLQVLCGIKEGDPEERILEVEPRLRALGLRDEEVTAVLFQLGASKKTGSSQNALKAAFARMVVSLSSDQLHVFSWDNAQSLDAQSLEMIENAVQRAEGSRAVFVFSVREGHHHSLEKHANHQLVEVADFDDAEVRELIAQRTGARIAPPELVTFCQERAKGHPLFTEELIKELFDSGALVVANGAVVELRLGGEISVPRPLRALMASRVSRLPAEERRALSAAAVLGEPLDLATLALMIGEPLARLDKVVASLEAREFIRRSGTSSVAFSSPLLREVIVDLLPAEARREMHAAAGAAYEAALGERAVEQAARVAAHFYEAGDRDRAAMYFARSGQRKLLGRHYDGAARDTIRALELADLSRRPAAELGAWLGQLASAVYRVRTAREIPQLVEQLLAHIDRSGDLATRVAARVDLGSILVSTHDFEGADAYLEAARTLAKGYPHLVRTAVLTEAELARRRGDYLKARDRFEEAQKLGTDDPTRAHRVFMGLALAYAASGDRARADAAVASADKLAPADDLALASERARLRQIVALFSHDWDTAVEVGQKSVELARQAGLAYEVAINLHVLGEGLFRQNELPRAYASFQQSAALCEEISEERLRAHNHSFLAYLDAVTDYDGACTTLTESIAYAHARSFTWDEVNARYLLAKLFQHKSLNIEAREEFERCRKLAEAVGFRMMVQECATALLTASG